MKKNNVFNVLVTKGDKLPLEIGKPLSSLTDGQIGFFDADTNLAVDETSGIQNFYVAVNVGGKIKKSVNNILSKNITSKKEVPCQDETPHIIEISDLKAYCNKQYGLKIEFKNTQIYNHYQHNAFSSNYIVDTPCCPGCGGDCEIVDCNELVKRLINAINNDNRGLVRAEAINPKTNSAITDIDKFISDNSAVNTDDDPTNDVCLKIRLTSIPLAVHNFCSINAKYYKPRLTKMIVSLTEGFECGATIKEIQEGNVGSGLGYDVMQREYEALGWESSSGAYRVSETTLLPNGNITYNADPNNKYYIFNIAHNNESFGGWQDYTNDIELEIAVPCKDDKTIKKLSLILNNIY